MSIYASKKLEAALFEFVKDLKDSFARNNQSYLNFDIVVSGRPDGDLRITYTIQNETYSSGHACAEGGNLTAVEDEFFRRASWQIKNAPLCLPNISE